MTASHPPEPSTNSVDSSVLLIRVWVEPQGGEVLRARLLTSPAVDEQPTTYATAAGSQAICAQVQNWLEAFAVAPRAPDAGPR